MNLKTILFEDYVNFVDSTKKQLTYFKISIVLFVVIVFLFSFFLLYKYLNKNTFFKTIIWNK